MKSPRRSRTDRLARLWPALVVALLAGCGGDEQIARTGGSGTGVATTIGTVTGFGSVIVDGAGWDERNARIETERNPAAGPVAAEVRLGQRVQIESSMPGSADRIVIEPDVIGRVSEVSAAAVPPRFKVAGQTVLINADAAAGPVTLFDGAAGIGALQAGDAVEVHGSARFDATIGRYVFVASRVERLASLPAGMVRVSGVVTSYSAADRRFVLGELSVSAVASTLVVPANRALANGQRVVAWSDDPLGAGAAGPTLTADFIRIVERSTAGSEPSEIAGVVGRFDPNALTLEVDGVPVNARASRVVPASQSLADGRYVIARGSFDAMGVLQAAQVRIRTGNAADTEIRLDGTITDFVSVSDFRVRGVAVNASGVNALAACPAAGLSNGLFVEIGGRIDPAQGRVVAERLRCVASAVGRVVTIEGLAGDVSSAARSFTLAPSGGPVRTVGWTDLTYFDGVTPATLAGRTLSVDGFGDGNSLTAIKIRLRP